MREVNCNVIHDILPLYLDGTVSNDTAEIVEEHIAVCKKCTEYKKNLEEDIVVKENDEGERLLRRINKKINRKIIVCVTAAVFLAVFLVTGGINLYRWMQVNRLVKLKTDEMSFNYMASPYIADDLEYLKRNDICDIADTDITGNSEDYLYMTYDISYDNKSLSDVKVYKKLISVSGIYKDNIVWHNEDNEDKLGKGKITLTDNRFIIYVGNLDESQKEELFNDLAIEVVFANDWYKSEKIIADTKDCRLNYIIKTAEDYKRVEKYYGDYNDWKYNTSEIYRGLGYLTTDDIALGIATGFFAVSDYDMRYIMTEGTAAYNYLFDIGDMDGYGILIESSYDLMTGEHIYDNVSERTYIVKKDTKERVMCIAGATLEQLEEITGRKYIIYGYNN